METPNPSLRREFLWSPHHAALALATLGLGFMTGHAFFLLLGAAAYALGWIYLPDMGFFKGWVDRRARARLAAEEQAQLAAFAARRDALLNKLTPTRRQRYLDLAAVCREIEAEGAQETPDDEAESDPRLRKLDELAWTFLRLLCMEEELSVFLEKERRDNLPAQATQTEQEIARLSAEIEAAGKTASDTARQNRESLRQSRIELLDVLRRRIQRVEQADANLRIVLSEQERLSQQIKLLRADKVARRGTEALSSRIDATVENLQQTHQLLAQMDVFKDLVSDLPPGDRRLGFGVPAEPPPLRAPARRKTTEQTS